MRAPSSCGQVCQPGSPTVPTGRAHQPPWGRSRRQLREQPLQAVSVVREQREATEAQRGVVEHRVGRRSEEHTSELQSLMRISYAVFCLKKKKQLIHSSLTSSNLNTHKY